MVQGKPYPGLLQRKNDRAADAGRIDDGAEEIAEGGRFRAVRQGAAAADTGVLAIATDVAVARARGGDAPVPAVAAPSRPDRAAMAHLKGADGGRGYRGHRAGACCVSARPEPVAHSA